MPSSTLSGMMPGASRWNIVGSRWPPVGVIACPAGTMRGPSIQPLSIARDERDVEQVAAGLHEQAEVAHGREAGEQRRAAVQRAAQRAERGVVLHVAARVARRSGPPRSMLSSMSMSPGSSVTSPRSISVAPLGTLGRVHRRDAVRPRRRSPPATAPRPRRCRPSGRRAGRCVSLTALGSIKQVEVRGAGVGDVRLAPALRPGTTP